MIIVKVEFAVLDYYPSFMSNECITVGILFHCITTGKRYFEKITNYKRLSAFDDELDIEFFKANLEGMGEQALDLEYDYNHQFNLNGYIKSFVNEYRFENIITMNNIEDLDSFIEKTKKIYLKFDYDKKERLNANEESAYIRNFLKSNSIPYSSKEVSGHYEEPIKFDYVIKQESTHRSYGIKIFKFKGKDIKRMVSSAKTWGYNAIKLSNYIDTIFILDDYLEDNEDYTTIYNILKDDAYKVMDMKEGLTFLGSIDINEQMSLVN